MKKSFINSIETLFIISTLLLYMGLFTRFFIVRTAVTTTINENNIYMLAFFAFSYLIAFLYFASHTGKLLFVIKKSPSIWLLILWASLSFLWSSAPEVTIRRSIALIGTTLFAAYLASRFSDRQIWSMFGYAFALLVAGSYLFSFFYPPESAWTGVYLTKNELTRSSILSICVFGYLSLTTKNFWGWFMLILGSLGLIYQSNSTTGNILITIIILISILLLSTQKLSNIKRSEILLITGIIGLFFAVLIYINLEQLFIFFEKDLSLTGRVPLWQQVLKFIWQSPLLGYGYGGFWLGWDGPSAAIWATTSWLPPHAHNGYLDITLDLGLIGLSLYIFFILSLMRHLFTNRHTSNYFKLFVAVFVFFLITYNLVENIALTRNSIVWVMGTVIFLRATLNSKIQL